MEGFVGGQLFSELDYTHTHARAHTHTNYTNYTNYARMDMSVGAQLQQWGRRSRLYLGYISAISRLYLASPRKGLCLRYNGRYSRDIAEI